MQAYKRCGRMLNQAHSHSIVGKRMDQADITASLKLRVIFVVVAAVMLALWGCSLIPPIENWGNPNEDGFSCVPVFYATITCLPVGLYLLVGAIAGRGRHIARARTGLYLGGGLLFLVPTFLIIQHIANTNDGRVFGVQIGFRLEYQDGRGHALDHVALSRLSWPDHGGLPAYSSVPRRIREATVK